MFVLRKTYSGSSVPSLFRFIATDGVDSGNSGHFQDGRTFLSKLPEFVSSF